MENHLTPNDHEAVNYFNLLSAFPMHKRRPLRTGRLHSAFQAEVEALSCLDARPPIKGFFGVAPTVRKWSFFTATGWQPRGRSASSRRDFGNWAGSAPRSGFHEIENDCSSIRCGAKNRQLSQWRRARGKGRFRIGRIFFIIVAARRPKSVLDCVFRRLILRPGFLSHLRWRAGIGRQ
jgi:hypothetical protein